MSTPLIHAFLTFVCMFVPAWTAGAQSIEKARTVYAEGHFMEAADLAQLLDTSEGYAFAAKSLAIYSYYIAPDSDKEGLFQRAADLARKAIRNDVDNPEAYLQLAHAMGRHAQTIGIVEALQKGYASQVRATIQEALRLNPDMPAAHLSLGAWHAGAVSKSAFFSGLLYGASEEDALVHFERALELAPENKTVLIEYALGLLSLDAIGNGAKARDLLERAITLPAKDAYDRIIHRKAVKRLAVLGEQ